MSWNYRIMRTKVELPGGGVVDEYGMHEVYYDESGKVVGWTQEPVTFGGTTAEEVANSLRMALEDAMCGTVLEHENGAEMESPDTEKEDEKND